MKNINFSFGYIQNSKFSYVTWKICQFLTFLPVWNVSLFKTYYNSDIPFSVRHKIEFGIPLLNFYTEFRKINGKWKYEKF